MNGGGVRRAGSDAARCGVELGAQRARLGLGPARRARHLCCLSQAAMPPARTPSADQHEDQHEQRHAAAPSAGLRGSNGSNETVTISRFATANITMTMRERNAG